EIADSVNVLASIIHFDNLDDDEKSPKEVSQSPTCECAEPDPKIENSHVVIIVEDSMCDKCNKV
ncbi:aluminum-activated malate transporter 2-like, partial [Trifolium medium]|nr:aluminum-activated malate transporter 2-like [Trifolium medium]